MKKCFRCGELKQLSGFYKHPRMADGHLNKCKTCAKTDAVKHRSENIDKVREYDRNRPNHEERTRDNNKRCATERGKLIHKKALAAYKVTHPKEIAARAEVAKAIRAGALVAIPCVICGDSRSQGHHEDYDRPLEVVWLCEKHHKKRHREINQERRQCGRSKKDSRTSVPQV